MTNSLELVTLRKRAQCAHIFDNLKDKFTLIDLKSETPRRELKDHDNNLLNENPDFANLSDAYFLWKIYILRGNVTFVWRSIAKSHGSWSHSLISVRTLILSSIQVQ